MNRRGFTLAELMVALLVYVKNASRSEMTHG
jgi:Tfp pilus assembly protein PilE